jgi:hypothetical protein
MTTLHERENQDERNDDQESATATELQAQPFHDASMVATGKTGTGRERRQHRRHDLAQQGILVDRWDSKRRVGKAFGQIVDISAGGVRIRTGEQNIRPDGQIRLRLELPDYAGISPFIDNSGGKLNPKREWIGWMAISRVQKIDSARVDIAGQLIDMDEIDRGMLGLYLSTQPLAA